MQSPHPSPTTHAPAMHTPLPCTHPYHAHPCHVHPCHACPHACMPPPRMHAPMRVHPLPHTHAPMHAYPCHTCKPTATYPHPVDRMRHPCENSTFRFEGGKQNQHKRECRFKFIYWSTFVCVCTLLL